MVADVAGGVAALRTRIETEVDPNAIVALPSAPELAVDENGEPDLDEIQGRRRQNTVPVELFFAASADDVVMPALIADAVLSDAGSAVQSIDMFDETDVEAAAPIIFTTTAATTTGVATTTASAATTAAATTTVDVSAASRGAAIEAALLAIVAGVMMVAK